MKRLIILFALLTWGCSSTKMINSPYGRIHKYQEKNIKEVRQYEGNRTIKIP